MAEDVGAELEIVPMLCELGNGWDHDARTVNQYVEARLLAEQNASAIEFVHYVDRSKTGVRKTHERN